MKNSNALYARTDEISFRPFSAALCGFVVKKAGTANYTKQDEIRTQINYKMPSAKQFAAIATIFSSPSRSTAEKWLRRSLSTSKTAITSPVRPNNGTTISDLAAVLQTM